MPLLFPIASSARAALGAQTSARTASEARERANGPVELVCEWLRPGPADRKAIQDEAEAGLPRGFVQLYEDAKGQPVIAVTFWKPVPPASAKAKSRPREPLPPAEDHTDDLYFEKKSGRSRRRKGAPDLNQLDLFTPDDRDASANSPKADIDIDDQTGGKFPAPGQDE